MRVSGSSTLTTSALLRGQNPRNSFPRSTSYPPFYDFHELAHNRIPVFCCYFENICSLFDVSALLGNDDLSRLFLPC